MVLGPVPIPSYDCLKHLVVPTIAEQERSLGYQACALLVVPAMSKVKNLQGQVPARGGYI